MLEFPTTLLETACTKLGTYGEDETDIFDINRVIKKEIQFGAQAFGVFGSRSKGTHQPNSDLDLLIVNSKARQLSELYGGLPLGEYAGRKKKLNKGGHKPWIHITRVAPIALLEEKITPLGFSILASTQFIWTNDDFTDLEQIATVLENFRNQQIEALIRNMDQSLDSTQTKEPLPLTRFPALDRFLDKAVSFLIG